MFPKSVLPLLLLCSVAFAAQAPVLLFGGSGESLPALSLVSSEKFSSIVQAENAMNVIFVAKEGKPEDFLSCTTESGETCFTGLKSIKDKTYYRHVDSPIETIKKSSGNCQVLNTNTDGQLVAPLDFAPNSCVIVNLFGNVQTQDALITKFLEDNKTNKIVALYTPNVTINRKARAVPSTGVFFNANPGFVMYYEKLQLCTLADKKTTCQDLPSENSALTITSSNDTSFSVSISNTGLEALTFTIVLDSAGYYELQNLQYGSNTFRTPGVNSLVTFSYFCGNSTFYQFGSENNALSLVFSTLQFQAPFQKEALNRETFAFGDPWHCVPFVSIPILAGLFVIAILLAILGVGICWLMDINTMDRFDDPKGKTITISATE